MAQTQGIDLLGIYDRYKGAKEEARVRGEQELAKNRLLEIGSIAGKGDYTGAANKALSFGNLEAGNNLLQIAQGQKKATQADNERIAGAFYNAKTPEQWARVVQYGKSQGIEFTPEEEDFNNRESIIGSAFGLDGQLKQANDDRNFNADEAYRSQTLGIDRERLALDRQKAESGGSDNEYGLNPVWTQDAEGKWHLYQPSKAGAAPQLMDFGGNTPQPTQTYLNQGTQFQAAPNRGAMPANPVTVPIDNAGKAAQTEIGKDKGGAAALHASLSSKLPGLQKVVGDLEVLADQATYTKGGQIYNYARKELGMKPEPQAVARTKYIAMVDNQVLPMLRDTFGAQFTVVEGEALRSTLGDPNKTPEEKKAVLSAFIEQKVRNIEAAAIQGDVSNGSELEDALEQYK